jgi:hypothetical protein
MFVATINVPGYLPMDDDPPVFETAEEAWAYLLEERERDIDVVWEEGDEERDETSEALADEWARAADPERDSTGTVYGPTPGSDGPHDPGVAYSVTYVYHAEDCDGSACDGCGWIDGLGDWHPGPCPERDRPFQQERSEGR